MSTIVRNNKKVLITGNPIFNETCYLSYNFSHKVFNLAKIRGDDLTVPSYFLYL
jgi:hypothetical protein